MLGVIALVASLTALATPPLDPLALPQLPARGLARETTAGVELRTTHGRPIGVLPQFNLAPDVATSRELLMRDRRGSLFVLDRRARRVRQVSEGPPPRRACRVTDRERQRQLVVCKSTIKVRAATGASRVVARGPSRIGHWERAAWAPDGTAFFAQWSGECEIPIAFYVRNGVMRPYGASSFGEAPESVALGWLLNGSAVIHFPKGACGKSQGAPGIYAVPRFGMTTLLVRTPRFEHYWMWGG